MSLSAINLESPSRRTILSISVFILFNLVWGVFSISAAPPKDDKDDKNKKGAQNQSAPATPPPAATRVERNVNVERRQDQNVGRQERTNVQTFTPPPKNESSSRNFSVKSSNNSSNASTGNSSTQNSGTSRGQVFNPPVREWKINKAPKDDVQTVVPSAKFAGEIKAKDDNKDTPKNITGNVNKNTINAQTETRGGNVKSSDVDKNAGTNSTQRILSNDNAKTNNREVFQGKKSTTSPTLDPNNPPQINLPDTPAAKGGTGASGGANDNDSQRRATLSDVRKRLKDSSKGSTTTTSSPDTNDPLQLSVPTEPTLKSKGVNASDQTDTKAVRNRLFTPGKDASTSDDKKSGSSSGGTTVGDKTRGGKASSGKKDVPPPPSIDLGDGQTATGIQKNNPTTNVIPDGRVIVDKKSDLLPKVDTGKNVMPDGRVIVDKKSDLLPKVDTGKNVMPDGRVIVDKKSDLLPKVDAGKNVIPDGRVIVDKKSDLSPKDAKIVGDDKRGGVKGDESTVRIIDPSGREKIKIGGDPKSISGGPAGPGGPIADKKHWDDLAKGDVAKTIHLADQHQLHDKGDIARRLAHEMQGINGGPKPIMKKGPPPHEVHIHNLNNMTVNVVNKNYYHGPISPLYQKSCFKYYYWGPSYFAGACWYPHWHPWVAWSWHYNIIPAYDPRPIWCRPIIYHRCEPWVVWETPRWEPLPEVACGTWVDVAAKPVLQNYDLQLLAVRFVDPGHPDEKTGPRYRVWFRNNSDQPIQTPFDVIVLADNGVVLDKDAIYNGVRITGIKPGEVQSVDIRLPYEVNFLRKNADGDDIPFDTLHVIVDANRTIPEATKENNGLMIARDEVLPIDPAAFQLDPQATQSGGEVILAGEGLGPQPGKVLVHIEGREYEAEILGWYDLGARVKLPKIALAQPSLADLIIVRQDGVAANPLRVALTPGEAPANPANQGIPVPPPPAEEGPTLE